MSKQKDSMAEIVPYRCFCAKNTLYLQQEDRVINTINKE